MTNFENQLSATVQDNYTDETFGVNELAKAMNLSRSQLHRKISHLHDKSTSEYLNEYRLKKAHSFMLDTDLTASEISYKVGYSSPTYFSTRYRDYFGFPPGETKLQENIINNNKASNSYQKKWLSVFILGIVGVSIMLYFMNLKNEEGIILKSSYSIAVLPFKNLSGDSNLNYFCKGITSTLISRLSELDSIDRVIPFSTMMLYQKPNKSISEIGEELKVSHIMEGTFQLLGDTIIIRTQMIDIETKKYFVQDQYIGNWNTQDIFNIQSKVTESLIDKMGIDLSKMELEEINYHGTNNVEAYNLYLMAAYQTKHTRESFDNAIDLYEKAIELDSSYVDAYVRLAFLWQNAGFLWGYKTENEAWSTAKKILEKGERFDQNSKITRSLFSGYFYYDWDFKKCEKFYNIELKNVSNDNIVAPYIDYAVKTGRLEEALWLFDRMPDEIFHKIPLFQTKVAEILLLKNQIDSAKSHLNDKDPLYQDNLAYLIRSAKLHLYLGQYDLFANQLDLINEKFPLEKGSIIIWLNAINSQLKQDNVKIEFNINELKKLYNSNSSGSPAWFLCLYYCFIENFENAEIWLTRSYDRHEVEMTWLKKDLFLRFLHSSKEYQRIYQKMEFPN